MLVKKNVQIQQYVADVRHFLIQLRTRKGTASMTYYNMKQLVISQIDKKKNPFVVLSTDFLRFMLASVLSDTQLWDV